MKIISTLICTSILSISGLNIINASAEQTPGVWDSLVKQAQGLSLKSEDEPVPSGPQVPPAWHAVEYETPGAGEQNFWDDLYTGISKKDACEDIALPIEYGYEAENLGSVAGSANRRFHRYPDKTLALVDEASLKLELSSERTLLDLAQSAGVSIVGGVRLEGSSMVIRPLAGKKACSELKQYANILKYKTVLPFRADRFSAMKNGEVWKIPVTLWTGFTPTVSGGYGNVSVSVSFGVENQRLPSVSISKLSDKELRVRLRIDQARILSVGGSVGVTIAPVTVALDNLTGALTSQLGSVVGGAAGKIIASKFEEYTYASMGLTHSDTKGKKVLLEFVLDPQNKEQMTTLAKLLTNGELKNIGALAKLALGMNFLPGHNSVTDETELQNMQNEWDHKLGIQPAYAGQNGYHETANDFTIHIPVVSDYDHTTAHNYQTVHTPGSPETIHINQSSRDTAHDLLHIPFVGTVARHNSHREITVFNTEVSGKVGAPVMVYEQFEGEIRHSESSAREILNGVNDIMRYVGTRGDGGSSSAAIPVDAIQPKTPVTYTVDPATGEQTPSGSPTYKAAFMSFAVMFNEKAVLDIISAPADMIIKAFFNSLDSASSAMMKKVLSVSSVGQDGRIKNKLRDIEKVLGVTMNSQDEQGVMNQVNSFCRTASRLVLDVIKIRTAPDWKTKSELLSRVIAGDSKSDLKYAEILKVFVQLVEPKDVAAELIYQAEKGKKGKDTVSVQYSFNHDDNPAFATVDHAKEEAEHFDEPAQLTD